MTYLRKLQIALDLFCLYEIGMAIVWIFMDIANGGISKLSLRIKCKLNAKGVVLIF